MPTKVITTSCSGINLHYDKMHYLYMYDFTFASVFIRALANECFFFVSQGL